MSTGNQGEDSRIYAGSVRVADVAGKQRGRRHFRVVRWRGELNKCLLQRGIRISTCSGRNQDDQWGATERVLTPSVCHQLPCCGASNKGASRSSCSAGQSNRGASRWDAPVLTSLPGIKRRRSALRRIASRQETEGSRCTSTCQNTFSR